MTVEDLDSFDEPTILHLTKPCRLHPDACNPQMDLVALLYLPTDEEIQEGSDGSSIELWRTSGEECVKVWEREVGGWVVGMDWSLDGLQLSLLSYPGFGASTSAQPYSLIHLSVHNGSPSATISIKSSHVPDKDTWLSMRWVASTEAWPVIEKGSAGNILDSLPGIEKVEPVLPPHAMYQFQPALALKAKKALDVPHSTLTTFPTLPAINSSTNPGILLIPPLSQELLSGTFAGSGELIMRLAQTSQRLKAILDNVIKGIESAQAAWKEALKQGQLWEEELEECETAAGEPKGSARAGLSLLLMKGHCLQSVSDFLSHRVTGRSLTKWRGTVTSSLATIHRLMINSVIPGLERVMVLLEDISGWAVDIKYHSLGVDSSAVAQCQKVAHRLAKMATLLNRDAEHKSRISHEFFDWLAYQVELVNNSDYADMESRPRYNVLDVWEYLDCGLVLEKTFKTQRSVHYFPSFDIAPFRGVVDPYKLCPDDSEPSPADGSLQATLDSTLGLLQGNSNGRESLSEVSIDWEDRSAAPAPLPDQSYPCLTDLAPELVRRCQEIVQSAMPTNLSAFSTPCSVIGPYVTEKDSWYAGLVERTEVSSGSTGVVFCMDTDNRLKAAAIDLPQNAQITSIDCIGFFDASEIACILTCLSDETQESYTMLATIEYQNLYYQDLSQYESLHEAWEAVSTLLSKSMLEPQPLTIARSQAVTFSSDGRRQPGIALNGRKKRRTACVLSSSGQEVQVFSLWISGVDDDGDDEDEEEDEEAVEGSDDMEQ